MTFLFLIVAGIIIFTTVKGLSEWSYNNSQPQLQHQAVVLTKKSEDTIHHNTVNDITTTTTDTSYYIVFQLNSGEQRKTLVRHRLYKSVQEGDRGTLTLQGSRFIGFEPELH